MLDLVFFWNFISTACSRAHCRIFFWRLPLSEYCTILSILNIIQHGLHVCSRPGKMPECGGHQLSLLHAPPAPGHRQDEGSCRQCPGAAQPRDDVLPRSYLQILISLCGANSQSFNNRLKGLLNLFRLVEWYCVDISTLWCIPYNSPYSPGNFRHITWYW